VQEGSENDIPVRDTIALAISIISDEIL